MTLDFIQFRPLRDVILAPPAISATAKLTQINLRLLKLTVVRFVLRATTAQLAPQSRLCAPLVHSIQQPAVNQPVTAFFAQLERQIVYTAQLVVSLADSSHLQLKDPKFALVLAKTEHTLQKIPLAVARQGSTSTQPKASVRDSPVPLRTVFQ